MSAGGIDWYAPQEIMWDSIQPGTTLKITILNAHSDETIKINKRAAYVVFNAVMLEDTIIDDETIPKNSQCRLHLPLKAMQTAVSKLHRTKRQAMHTTKTVTLTIHRPNNRTMKITDINPLNTP